MSLPKDFDSPEDYFEEGVKFFIKYNYLYSFPNTELLVHNVLDKILIDEDDYAVSSESLDFDTLHNEVFLRDFFSSLERLKVLYADVEELSYNLEVPVGPKKKHEIIHLVEEINTICKDVGCDVVVDFGCGLGYLDQLLFEKTNFKILGLECNENHYVGAKKRQRKYHTTSIDKVKFIKHTIDKNSHGNINDFLKDKFQNQSDFCITGLHACADLTIDSMHLFMKMEDAKALVLMPCCYHMMALERGVFKNFPLSACLRNVFKRYEGNKYMTSVPFLRLAAQPPNLQDELDDLVFNLLSRAVLQLYAQRHNCKLKRKKRKPVKTRTMKNDFQTYLEDAVDNGFTLIENVPASSNQANQIHSSETHNFDFQEIIKIWNELTPLTRKKAGLFIVLQNHLQPVIENFVLYDRIKFMKENGIEKCCVKKILNDKTSPRCLALVASK